MKTYSIPKIIVFSGIDGSGKTTYIKMLEEHFAKQGIKYSTVWMRMNYLFSKPLLLYARISGLTERKVVDGKKISIHNFQKHKLFAILLQVTHLFDTFLYSVFKIYLPYFLSKKIIICDRYIYDILIDFGIESGDINILEKRIMRIAKIMLPPSHLTILINTPKNDIIKRRPDVLLYDPFYNKRYNYYKELEAFPNIITIQNDTDIELVFKKITNLIYS